jgi:eukaryotic-like serine/threonine-protein kinase
LSQAVSPVADCTLRRFDQNDRNLLFGLLALQAELIDRKQFLEISRESAGQSDRPLADLLLERGWLSPEDRDEVEHLLERKLQEHGGDIAASVAELRAGPFEETLALNPIPQKNPSPGENEGQDGGSMTPTAQYQAELRGRHVLTRFHAKGGIGKVWLAHDPTLGRDVALKELLPERGHDPRVAARFLQEARITGQLEHPGIVPVYELVWSSEDDKRYYTMRFVNGLTLRQASLAYHKKLRAGTATVLDLRRLLDAFVRVCNAVAYAHSRGVLHRDLKGQNVILGEYGEVVLLDWGLAKPLGPESSSPNSWRDTDGPAPVLLDTETPVGETLPGQLMGTPGYMAPEQAQGRQDRVDARTDIYGLGAILFEILTGQPPHKGLDSTDVIRQTIYGDTPRARAIAPSVPPALDAVCARALSKTRAERYATATELAEEVQRYLADEPVHAWQEPRRIQFRRWLGRHRTLVTSAAAVLVVSTIGLAAGLALLAESRERERAARFQEQGARGLAEAERDRARLNLYISQMRLARHAWDKSQIGRVLDLLQEQDDGEADRRLRGFEWHYLQRLCHADRRTLRGHRAEVAAVAFAPDSRLLASAGHDGEIRLWETATGREVRTIATGAERVDGVVFSPDGRLIASAGSDWKVMIWETATGRQVRSLAGHNGPVLCVAFSPDGRRLASGSADYNIRIWDLEGGKEARTLEGHQGWVLTLAFSPDGQLLASGGRDRLVKLWPLAAQNTSMDLKGHTGQVGGVAFNSDGSVLVSADWDGTLKTWEVSSGKELHSLQAHEASILGVSFSPDGHRIATACADSSLGIWAVAGARSERLSPLASLKGHEKSCYGVTFASDGRLLASAGADGTARLWDSGEGAEALSLIGHTKPVRSLAFSAHGQRLASAGGDHTVRIWELATGRELQLLLARARELTCVAFESTGKHLAIGGGLQGEPGRLKVLDVVTGTEVFSLTGHTGPVHAVAFHPRGGQLASAGTDSTVRVWNLATGEEVRLFTVKEGAVNSVVYHPDGVELASAGADGMVRIWDLVTGSQVRDLPPGGSVVNGLAYRPDGRRLAAACADGQVRVWDLPAGEQTLVLKGHAGAVNGLAFCPDGRRLATCGADGTVRLWEMQTGQEILSLGSLKGEASTVAFSPDGQRLAAAGGTELSPKLRVWESGPCTEELWRQHEAMSVLRFLLGKQLAQEEAVAQLAADTTLAEPVRQKALDLVEPYWQTQERAAAFAEVERSFGELLLRQEVLASLRTAPTLLEPRKRLALALAEQYPEDFRRLEQASWDVAWRRDRNADSYRTALRQAEAAHRLAPGDADVLNTYGVALYRTGNYGKAVAILARSEQINTAGPAGPLPSDLAFLAMGQQRLGETARARATFARLREAMKKPQWAKHYQATAFLEEAERVLGGSGN